VKELFFQFKSIYRKTLARLGVTDLKLGSERGSETEQQATRQERITQEELAEEGEVGDEE
jgi:hypothetical protein